MIDLVLPYPPTVNHYWQHTIRNGRHNVNIKQKGAVYRVETMYRCKEALKGKSELVGRLGVEVFVSPPDRRKRDLDNILKALLDALGHAGVYQDDSQIDELIVRRQEPQKGGSVRVRITELQSCNQSLQ
ncbi:MAG: RusA family crossover junction endodeoxyribonuclease [Motiliproteus sp.]|nr:RusA family crossover junction endodeoxyribonuclease [Motiliproteus sp.]MCW9051253.1 RusA family crossover junction endodeoxyribonuclease [Motiliproteus sp.]